MNVDGEREARLKSVRDCAACNARKLCRQRRECFQEDWTNTKKQPVIRFAIVHVLGLCVEKGKNGSECNRRPSSGQFSDRSAVGILERFTSSALSRLLPNLSARMEQSEPAVNVQSYVIKSIHLSTRKHNMATRRGAEQEKTHLDQDEIKEGKPSNISPAVPG